MKRQLFFAFALFFLSYEGFSDQIAYTETGQKVVLHDDGTWEYLKQEKQISDISTDKVILFPERYIGQTLILNDAILSGGWISKVESGLIKFQNGDFYCLSIKGKVKQASSYLDDDALTFVTSSQIAEQLLEIVDSSYQYKVRLHCKVREYKDKYFSYWLAEVFRIDFYKAYSNNEFVRTIP